MGLNKNEVCDMNWNPKLDKLKSVLLTWSKRRLSLYGKITIIKTLAVSKIVYNMSIIDTPL